jgi:hypothetical protein
VTSFDEEFRDAERDVNLWAGLVRIEVQSGTADDGENNFRGFVTVTARDEGGGTMKGQLSSDDLRAMAMQFLESAEAAEQDALVFKVLVNEVDIPASTAAYVVRAMRKERGHE